MRQMILTINQFILVFAQLWKQSIFPGKIPVPPLFAPMLFDIAVNLELMFPYDVQMEVFLDVLFCIAIIIVSY